MKNLFPLTILFLLSLALCLSAHAKDVGGPIIDDTIWTKAESPFIVKSHVTVIEDVTLTIQPGVTVKFDKTGGFHASEYSKRVSQRSRVGFSE